jgi:hypothetical protein
LTFRTTRRPGSVFADEVVVAIPSLGQYKARRCAGTGARAAYSFELTEFSRRALGALIADRFPGLGGGIFAVGDASVASVDGLRLDPTLVRSSGLWRVGLSFARLRRRLGFGVLFFGNVGLLSLGSGRPPRHRVG